jgi:hypothetical protein
LKLEKATLERDKVTLERDKVVAEKELLAEKFRRKGKLVVLQDRDVMPVDVRSFLCCWYC